MDTLNPNAITYLLEEDQWMPRFGRRGNQVWIERYAMLTVWELTTGWEWNYLDDILDPRDSVCTWNGVFCNIDDEIVKLEFSKLG